MLFKEEVNNLNELINLVKDKVSGQIKVAVVCMLFDEDNKLILHRRGPGARDEVGKLLAIGGSYNASDGTFRSALLRELNEEAGSKAHYELGEFIGGLYHSSFDNIAMKQTNWIILGYKGTFTGELENVELDRCSGFERYKVEDLNRDELGISTIKFLDEMYK